MTDEATIARRVARLRDDLRTAPTDGEGLTRALDAVTRSLDRIRQGCVDDDDLALRLGTPSALAASYVRATMHLAEAGVDPSLRDDVLRRGQDRVSAELADVEHRLHTRKLAAPYAPGGR